MKFPVLQASRLPVLLVGGERCPNIPLPSTTVLGGLARPRAQTTALMARKRRHQSPPLRPPRAATAESKRITFLRHGQSEGNAAKARGISRSDPCLLDCGLTRLGVQQAQAAGAAASREPELVVVSILKRAIATALHLKFPTAKLVAFPGIKEIGSRIPENQARSLKEIRRDRDLCEFQFDSGAALEDFAAWLRGRPERDIWVVAHNNSIAALLRETALAGRHLPHCVPLAAELDAESCFRLVAPDG